jgi:hypothetical protein
MKLVPGVVMVVGHGDGEDVRGEVGVFAVRRGVAGVHVPVAARLGADANLFSHGLGNMLDDLLNK